MDGVNVVFDALAKIKDWASSPLVGIAICIILTGVATIAKDAAAEYYGRPSFGYNVSRDIIATVWVLAVFLTSNSLLSKVGALCLEIWRTTWLMLTITCVVIIWSQIEAWKRESTFLILAPTIVGAILMHETLDVAGFGVFAFIDAVVVLGMVIALRIKKSDAEAEAVAKIDSIRHYRF